jgi:GNAT superfamily N-acetyltransferase
VVITFKLVSLDDPALLATASLLEQWGQEEGTIPRDRLPVSEFASAIFAFADTPAGSETVVGGAVFYQPDGHDMLFLDVLFVSSDYRRRGIGGDLIEKVISQARDMGIAKVEFGTLVGNLAMQALGRRHGFADVAIFMSCPVVAPRFVPVPSSSVGSGERSKDIA